MRQIVNGDTTNLAIRLEIILAWENKICVFDLNDYIEITPFLTLRICRYLALPVKP